MSSHTNNPDLKSMDRVLCECGSDILLKNMSQHVKTQKHMKAMEAKKNPVAVKEVKIKVPEPPKPKPVEDVDDESSEEEDELDILVGGFQAMNERLDDIEDMLEAICVKLGVEAIPEGDEDKSSGDPSKDEVKVGPKDEKK